jgi:hypothetical protein
MKEFNGKPNLKEESLVFILNHLVNRKERREAKREKEFLVEPLSKIILAYQNSLFLFGWDYKDVYQHYLEMYRIEVDWLSHTIKTKWYTIDKYYFRNAFKYRRNGRI